MGLFDAFESSSRARQTAELAHQVARRSCPAVWHKVNGRVAEMTVAEARGYIRAHALAIVQAEADRCGCAADRRPALVELAREAVVETLASEVARLHRTQTVRRWAA